MKSRILCDLSTKQVCIFNIHPKIPVFNLLKIHGSINWAQTEANGIKNNINWSDSIDAELGKISTDSFVDIYYTDNTTGKKYTKTYDQLVSEAKKLEISDKNIYESFLDAYRSLIIINPTKRKFELTVVDYHFYELMRIYANALEKENTLLFVAGFSFADEHIATITKRAAESNPTLQIIVFAFNDEEEASFKEKLGITSVCLNNNITILTPSKFKNANQDDTIQDFVNSIKQFDIETIAKVFSYVENNIHG